MPSRGRQTVSRVKKQTKRPNNKQYEATLFQNEKELFIRAGNPTASPGYALFQALEILSYL